MDERFTGMRDFIMATENLNLADLTENVPEPSGEPLTEARSDGELLSELANVVFRLRAFMESSDGDYALGVEMGMQRAADMIENVLRRHSQGD